MGSLIRKDFEGDIFALAPEASNISDISYVMEADEEEVEKILG